jgi:hypothetical protein
LPSQGSLSKKGIDNIAWNLSAFTHLDKDIEAYRERRAWKIMVDKAICHSWYFKVLFGIPFKLAAFIDMLSLRVSSASMFIYNSTQCDIDFEGDLYSAFGVDCCSVFGTHFLSDMLHSRNIEYCPCYCYPVVTNYNW